MQEKRKWIIPYIILGLVMFGMFIIARENQVDDAVFRNYATHNFNELIAFGRYRYYSWSSRFIAEASELLLLDCSFWVWRAWASISVVILAYGIKVLLGIQNDIRTNIFICIMVAGFPLSFYASSGWVTATTVYLLSAVCLVIAIIPLGKIYRHESIRLNEGCIYFLSALIACNVEQSCAICLGAYICSILYFGIRRKKIYILLIIQSVVSIISMIFILLCPGNKVRLISEISTWNLDFVNWNLWEKIGRGIVSASDGLFFSRNVNISVLGIVFVIVMLVCLSEKNIQRKIASVLCFVIYSVFVIAILFTRLGIISEGVVFNWGDYGQNSMSRPLDWIRIAFAIFYALFILIQVYWIIGMRQELCGLILIWSCSFGSSVMLGFSPTIYVSGIRIHTYAIYGLMVLVLWTLKLIWDRLGKQKIRFIMTTQAVTFFITIVKNIASLVKMYF